MRLPIKTWLCSTAVILVVSCSGGPSSESDALDTEVEPEIFDEDFDFEVEPPALPEPPESPALPVLTPCPAGWQEVPPDDESGIATCEPWPDGDPVSLPVLTPCPAGWREIPPGGEGDVATCEPWPEGGPHECEENEAHFIGESGCTHIGSPCPAGEWADGLPDTGVLYVSSDAARGGDGTQASPFNTIVEATTEATPETIIAIGKGTYDEIVEVPAGVTLWGACVAETIIASSETSETEATVTAGGAECVLSNLQVGGARTGILAARSDASLLIVGVLVEQATEYGVWVMGGASLTAQDLVVRGTRAGNDGSRGRGLRVEDGCQADIMRAIFEQNRQIGVFATDSGTTLSLTDVVVRETEGQQSDGLYGVGLQAQVGAHVEVIRGVFEHNRLAGVAAIIEGTVVTLRDIVVHDTQSDIYKEAGYGLGAELGGQIEMNRGLLDHNRMAGALAIGSGSALTLTDVVVRDTQPQEIDRDYGDGLRVQAGAQAQVTRGLFLRNRNSGVSAAQTGTMVLLSDIAVRDTQGTEINETSGIGLDVFLGAEVQIDRGLVERNRIAGISALDTGTRITVTDLVVRDTNSPGAGLYGAGLQAASGAEVEIVHGVVERNHGCGILISDEDTSVRLMDIVVRETQAAGDDDEKRGPGLHMQLGAHVEVNRSVFDHNIEHAVSIHGDGTTAGLSDILIRDTQSRTDGQFGRGLGVESGAEVEVSRAFFERNREAAVFAFGGGTIIRLEDLTVRETLERPSDNEGGLGMYVIEGAQAAVSRAVFEKNREGGITIRGVETVAELTDIVVADTWSRASDQRAGEGLTVFDGPQVVVRRALFHRNRWLGIYVGNTGTTLTLEDVKVSETYCSEENLEGGAGMSVYEGAQVTGNRLLFEKNHTVGVLASDEHTAIDLTDLTVSDTLGQESDGDGGHGLAGQDGAHIMVNRAIFIRNRDAGVSAWSSGTQISLENAVVSDTQERDCVHDTCSGFGAGNGLLSCAGAHVEMSSFIVTQNALCGLQLAHCAVEGATAPLGGTMDLHNGEVSYNSIGANVQTEEFDVNRLMDNVIYIGNEVNLDTSQLPVPEMGIEL